MAPDLSVKLSSNVPLPLGFVKTHANLTSFGLHLRMARHGETFETHSQDLGTFFHGSTFLIDKFPFIVITAKIK